MLFVENGTVTDSTGIVPFDRALRRNLGKNTLIYANKMSNTNVSESGGLLDDTVEMVRSNKGGAKIIHRGYMYTVHKRRIGGIRWRCARRILHCKGSITTSAGAPPVINLPHNHVPDLHAVAQARCRSYGSPDDSLSGHAELLGLQLGPTAKYVTTVPAEDYNQFNTAAEQMMEPVPPVEIKEEFIDEKPIFNSPSPAPSTTSMKSMKKIPPVPKLQNIKAAPVRSLKSASSASSVVEEAEVCLRWNSHHSNMQTAFPSLMDEKKYVDVTLAAEGQIIKCHKLILSSCSTYFDDMLKSVEANQHPIIFIPKMEFWIVKALVEFMYKGEVNVDQSKLQILIQSATELQIKGLAKQTSVKDEFEEPENPQSENDEAFDEYLPDSPSFVPDPEDDEFKPYNYSPKKNKKKPKKRKIPEPGQLKTVPCNLRGTKSRPNIKQPVFYDPDFPDHQSYRSTSSPAFVKEPIFDMDDIKMEPLDIMPNSPTYYNNENNDFHKNNQDKLPLVVELKSGNEVDFEEPPMKKSLFETRNENHSPITIECVNNSIEKDSGVQLSLEKIQPNAEQLKSEIQKKFCIRIVKSNKLEENNQVQNTDLDKSKVNSLDENLPSTSKTDDFTFKKIKLPTTESVLRKLAENKDDMVSEEKDDINCDSKENEKDLSV